MHHLLVVIILYFDCSRMSYLDSGYLDSDSWRKSRETPIGFLRNFFCETPGGIDEILDEFPGSS